MRSIEEVKKEQDGALYELGYHTFRAEQLKSKIHHLAKEAEEIHKAIKEEKEQ